MGKLLLVGCGKMGGAMLDGWLARGLAVADVVVADLTRKQGRLVGLEADAFDTQQKLLACCRFTAADKIDTGDLGQQAIELARAHSHRHAPRQSAGR